MAIKKGNPRKQKVEEKEQPKKTTVIKQTKKEDTPPAKPAEKQTKKYKVGDVLNIKELDTGYVFSAKIVSMTAKQVVFLDVHDGSRDKDTHFVTKPISGDTVEFYEGKWKGQIVA